MKRLIALIFAFISLSSFAGGQYINPSDPCENNVNIMIDALGKISDGNKPMLYSIKVYPSENKHSYDINMTDDIYLDAYSAEFNVWNGKCNGLMSLKRVMAQAN